MRRSDAAFAALALAGVSLVSWIEASIGRPVEPPPPVAVKRPRPAVVETVRHDELGDGETLTQVLGRLGVKPAEIPEWIDAARPQLDPRSLPIGLQAEGVVDRGGAVRAVRLTPDWRSRVVLERASGGIQVRREDRPVERELTVIRGTVISSLFEAVTSLHERDDLALALADVFQWDIDFHREVREGDTFAVLVERVRAEGRTVAYGPIVAATYVNAGRRYASVRFGADGSSAGYYDNMGRPLRKQFLRAPLRFTRLTSRFSTRRLHPILGRRMPHWGVDYGAPVGTPVMATADGVVTFRGWRGGGGNEVEMRHAGGYVTAYLHLSRFAAGIKPGVRVAQGQVIGFVGATGLATGPHLDYRITRNGQHLNPLTIGKEPAPALSAAEKTRFDAWSGQLLPLLDTPGALQPATVAALKAATPMRLGG